MTDWDDLPERFIEKNSLKEQDPYLERWFLYDNQFYGRIGKLAENAKKFVCYTQLNRIASKQPKHRPYELVYEPFVTRLLNSEVSFHRMEVFFHEKQILYALVDKLRFSGCKYYCQYFPTPRKSIPVINMRSFDNEFFVIGGYHLDVKPGEEESALASKNREPLATFLIMYFDELSKQAFSFPNPDDWSENSVKISFDLNITAEKWQSLVNLSYELIDKKQFVI